MSTKTIAKRKLNGHANDHTNGKKLTRDAAIIQRLTVAKTDSDAKHIAAGRKFGITWAEDDARLIELERLERYVAGGGLDLLEKCASPKTEFYEVIDPGMMFYCGEFPLWLWEDCHDSVDPDLNDGAFCCGVALGALAVWARIKPRVLAASRAGRNTAAADAKAGSVRTRRGHVVDRPTVKP